MGSDWPAMRWLPTAQPSGQYRPPSSTSLIAVWSSGPSASRGSPIGSVPFDFSRHVIPNRDGRAIDPESGETVPGTYVTGWIKRGPSGVIGTNKQCAKQTVECLIEDFLVGALAEPTADLEYPTSQLPAAFDVRAWRAIDAHERREGIRSGRPRVKLVDPAALLAVASTAVTEPAEDEALGAMNSLPPRRWPS